MLPVLELLNNITLSVSGGTEKMKAYGSFGYLDNTGTLKGQSYKRYSGTANVDITPTKWFSMGANLNTSYGINEYGQSNIGRTAVTSSGRYICILHVQIFLMQFLMI